MKTAPILASTSPNSSSHVLFASMIGTTIELFDFYIYATAAVLVFPRIFFPAFNPASATLASLATFGIAFLSRPIGSGIFGHFGDRVGRKKTLIFALGTMGFSTVAIGALPTYHDIGVAAPLLLVLCRLGQGLGLGGEWGGAVLLAVESAPAPKRAWYGMFPQLGAPLGFFLSSAVFLQISRYLNDQQFFQFGWRLPFLGSAVLVGLGFYVRLRITETPEFRRAIEQGDIVRQPMLRMLRDHSRSLLTGILLSIPTFILFYLLTVFALSCGTSMLGYSRRQFLSMQLVDILFFAIAIPISAALAERQRRRLMLWSTAAILLFGFVMAPLFESGTAGSVLMLAVGFSLMGLTYGPLGTTVSDLFPTPVRYTGVSIALSFGAILGASVSPYITTTLSTRYGLPSVGYYLTGSAILAICGLLLIPNGLVEYYSHWKLRLRCRTPHLARKCSTSCPSALEEPSINTARRKPSPAANARIPEHGKLWQTVVSSSVNT